MITPRQTRLLRVRNLRGFRRATVGLLDGAPSGSFGLVPSFGAAVHLSRSGAPLQNLITRDQLYEILLPDCPGAPRWLTAFERDAMMQSAASTSHELPFEIRPGLIGEMLRFYDQLRRQSQSVQRFRELLEGVLGGGAADADRGTERLLKQTRFLADAFTTYERLLAESDAVDEHALRERVLTTSSASSLKRLVITVADWIADPDGLFVADFDLLARLPGLEQIDIVCTESVLGSGFHERLHNWWPGIEEQEEDGERDASGPRLAVPPEGSLEQPCFTYRDREEELLAIARRLQPEHATATAPPASLERTGIAFVRPLPYLYLAAEALGASGIAFQSTQALPLAAEPIAAAVDLLLDALETNFTRPALLAVLRCPHFQGPAELDASMSALDRYLSQKRYLGEAARLEALDDAPAAVRPALESALSLVRALVVLLEPATASTQVARLKVILEARLRPIAEGDRFADRETRGRQAILQLLDDMARAHATHHDPVWQVEDLAGNIRRWISEQTFSSAPESAGVLLLDEQSARYADVDDLTLVGLIENEWPERPRRNIFFPGSLLRALGWPSERDRRSAAEARFLDLLASPRLLVRLSTFTLEDEALVTRSILLDEVPRARLSVIPEAQTPDLKVALTTTAADAAGPTLTSGDFEPRYHGSLGPIAPRAWTVSALETYLDCPFKFFAQHMLRLQEEPEEEEVMDPRRQGQFVHKVFEQFFREWQASGRRGITAANLDDARQFFPAQWDPKLGIHVT